MERGLRDRGLLSGEARSQDSTGGERWTAPPGSRAPGRLCKQGRDRGPFHSSHQPLNSDLANPGRINGVTDCVASGTTAQGATVDSPEITPWHASFGMRLRRARNRARYSTREVAAELRARFHLQLSHGSLARIERGEQRISVGLLGALCELYDVAPVEVAVGADPDDGSGWYEQVRDGLDASTRDGLVWLEQMLANGFAVSGPDAGPDGQLDLGPQLDGGRRALRDAPRETGASDAPPPPPPGA